MGQIRNYQTEKLRLGAENISYKRYDYTGAYVETVDENILFECPKDLIPLNKDLVKNYDRPYKKVEFITDLSGNYFKNENGHFLYDDRHWSLANGAVQTNALGNTGTDVEIITDQNQTAKALSGNKYFHSDIVVNYTTPVQMIGNQRQHCVVKTRQPITVEFDYYIETTGTDETYQLAFKYNIQKTYAAGSSDYTFDFENDEYVNFSQSVFNDFTTTTVNAWGKASFRIKGYQPTDAEKPLDEVHAEALICFPNIEGDGGSGGFQNVYIDNFRIAESYEVENHIVSRREQYDYTDRTYTGQYKAEQNVLSNEAQTTEYFIGKIDGYFRRTRDTADKTLEQIITQEIMNDNRYYMTSYEGTFRGGRDGHLSLHNKVWIDFGADVLQEPVSCYLDAMKYDIKASEYQIRMHIPNQDDDIGSTYNVIVE